MRRTDSCAAGIEADVRPVALLLLFPDSIFFFSFFLIYMACRSYLPNHLRVISRRAKYYLLGNEDFISL